LYHTKTTKEKIRLFLAILWPILVTQVGYNAMTLFDTIMSGKYGTEDLAAVAIGSSLWSMVFVSVNGLLLAVTPIVSQYVGAGRKDRITPTVTQALYLSFVIGVLVIVAGLLFVKPILTMMQLEPAVHELTVKYLTGLSFGIVPLFLSTVIRNFFDAQGQTKITMRIIIIAVPLNIALNYVLIFGKLGLPAFGGPGAGYATAIAYWIILIISVWMTFRIDEMRSHELFRRWSPPSLRAWKELLAIGTPIGLSVFFEASIFSVMTLLMGSMFDTATIAAHQAAISWSGLLFMMPLSISMALTILVGYEVGAARLPHAKAYSRIGVTSALGIIALSAVVLYFHRDTVAYFFTDSPEVAALIQQFLIYVIFFQLSDASQASLQGALRGYKDVTIPFLIALIAYWIIGIPAGYALASWTAFGPFGFWVGIIAGLTCAAAGFFLRLRIVQKRLSPRPSA